MIDVERLVDPEQASLNIFTSRNDLKSSPNRAEHINNLSLLNRESLDE